MEKVAEALKSLGRCTGLQMAKYLGREPQEVIIDLKYLQDSGRAHCVNGIWRPQIWTKPVIPGKKARVAAEK